ncbi:MAG: transposase IS4 family protein, partial [Candidatus Parvibacillus calidus]
MDKSTHFFGQSVFGQLISFLDVIDLTKISLKHKADHYVKKFKSKDHLISMLFCVFAKCSSLREVSGAMLGLSGKTKHFKLKHIPYRSTLSDANKRRTADFFADVYRALLKKYQHLISDSRMKDVIKRQIEIFDSTTISLFQDIMKCVGRTPANGKRKGGIKMHTVI